VWQGNDGRFPGDSAVEVRYPRDKHEERQVDRAGWPWLPGSIVGQCGPDEWYVAVCARPLAVLEDGSPAPAGTAEDDLFYPCCWRDASEIRYRPVGSAAPAPRNGAGR
jgi:hypothetical protein